MIVCNGCGKSKPLNEYYKSNHPSHKNGYTTPCKQCQKEKQRDEYTGEYHANRLKNLPQSEKDKMKNYRTERARNVRKNNTEQRLKEATRARIYNSIKDGKDRNTEEYIGCSITEYKQHIESQFTSEMTWNNWGSYWEIDHIIPLSKGGTFNVENTQPLLKSDNRKKSAKVIK